MAHTIITETCEGYEIASMLSCGFAFILVKNIKGLTGTGLTLPPV